MTLSDLLDEFNVVIDTAEGLTELRSLILGLAVRGKLVPQDPNDEPASELQKKIEGFWNRKYENGDIRKPKIPKPITEDEIPFDIPAIWKWTKLGKIIQVSSGDGLTKKAMNDGAIPVYGGNGVSGYHDSFNRSEETLVIGRVGYYCGATHITPDKSWVTDNAFITYFSEEHIFIHFLNWFLKATDLQRNEGSTAQPVISGRKIYPIPFPLPPLAEQHRIVQKIESLFAEVNELEAKLNRQSKLDEKLQMAVNAEVQQAPDAEASQSAWNFITSNFDILYHTSEAIDNLKKNILNEAVRGRLVPQNPEEEPASELLKKIEAEKERLYEEGEIRKPKDLPSVKEDEIPFDIPESWEWSRVGFFTTKLGAGKTPLGGKDNYQDEGIPFLRSQNVWNDGLDLEGVARIPESIHQDMINTEVKPNDLLINITGASIGRCTIVPSDFDKGNVSQHVCIIRLINNSLNKYFHFLLTSPFAWRQVMSKQVGISREGLSKNKVRDFLISLPPLEEQQRIAQRIEELFAICDQFKAQLEQRENVNERLVKGLVGEVLEGY